MTDWTTLTRPSAGGDLSLTTFFDPLKDDLTYLRDLVVRQVTNNVGTVISRGYVGVISGTADNSLLSTTTVADGRIAAVVVDPTIAAGSAGYVALAGNVETVLVTGAVARGDTLQTSGSAGYAIGGSVAPFARSLKAVAGPGAGTVAAVLYAAPVPATPQVQELRDTAGVQRFIPAPTAKTISDAGATSLFEIACAAGASVAGVIHFSVFATDGTDHQSLTGVATYAAVNKAGTITRTITYTTAPEAKAVSAGTLTLVWTMTDDTNKATVKLTPTGSLTESTYTVLFTVLSLRGVVTLL